MKADVRAPDVTFATLTGEELRLSALRGAPVVLTFLRYIG
jgi:peroxiredoxin